MFHESSSGSSELDAVVASINVFGVQETRRKWERHWNSALKDEDLEWLVGRAACNCVRIPIGYFTLGPEFCVNTPFAMAPAEVYVNAWKAVVEIIERCVRFGVGVLIDFHALPGGANAEAHSGTSSGKAELWENQMNLDLAVKCIEHIAKEVVSNQWGMGVVGVGICNEAVWEAPGIFRWYENVIRTVSLIDLSLPIYISDAWNLEKALHFTSDINRAANSLTCPVIIDTHQYFTFAEHHTKQRPSDLIRAADSSLNEIYELSRILLFERQASAAVFVGEYSCVMAESSWKRSLPAARNGLVKEFGNVQSRRWQKLCSGAAFWTYRMDWMDWMDGGDWGFKQQVNDEAIIAPPSMTYLAKAIQTRISEADDKRDSMFRQALKSHSKYWDKQSPDTTFEHWRYAEGWTQGWTDARDFFQARTIGERSKATSLTSDNAIALFGADGAVGSFPARVLDVTKDRSGIGADVIGALDLWILKRMKVADVIDDKRVPFGWEWEHGFRAGIKAFHGVSHDG